MGEGQGEGDALAAQRSGDKGVMLRRAREMGSNQTPAERVLWNLLRAKRFAGSKFVRQAPMGGYIADFCCFSRGLIIEVDGGQHDSDRERDIQRSRFLESQGFAVLRFWNSDVLNNLEGVASEVERRLSSRPLTRRVRKRFTGEPAPASPRSPSP